jgi:hypothetical protein
MTPTWWLIVGTAVIWIVYDILMYLEYGNKATESVLIE